MIKKVLRTFVIESTSLYLATQIASGLFFEKGFQSLLLTGAALTLTAFLVKPIINVLLLPINLVTFNFFKWSSHAITLFLVDLALSEFTIKSFNFLGYKSDFFDLPPLFLEGGVFSYLAFSMLISVIANIMYWLVDR